MDSYHDKLSKGHFMSMRTKTFLLISAVLPMALTLACSSGGSSGTYQGTAPTITAQPSSTTITEFDSLTLQVSVSGSEPLSYQWFKNGNAIAGAHAASYSLAMARSTDAGSYTVTVSNPTPPTVTSQAAILTINPYLGPPKILNQPKSQSARIGQSVAFTVDAAGGTGTFHYVWSKDGVDLPGSDASSYAIASMTSGDAGSYRVKVTNDQGSTLSAAAALSLQASPDGSFTATGKLNTARSLHTATLLQNGLVLIVGGTNASSGPLNTAELYDPTTGKFTLLTHTLRLGRSAHTATLLADGTVLIVGGSGIGATYTTEIFDPSTKAFSDGPNLSIARYGHTATLRPDGSLLVLGGSNTLGVISTGELIHASTPSSATLNAGRYGHTATLLATGDVLVAGGYGAYGPALATAELAINALPNFTLIANGLISARAQHSDTLLLDGNVLLVGGRDANAQQLASAEIYDPAKKSFTATQGNLKTARRMHTATRLADGTVLIVGGDTGLGGLSSAEIFTPSDATFHLLASTLNDPRSQHTATLLPDGSVLVVGGYSGSNSLDTAAIYH
jgi:Immunoglobulin domain/Galactose oxidase, central domain